LPVRRCVVARRILSQEANPISVQS